MKVLDKYLIRELMGPIVGAAITLVFLILIADLFDNIDDLLSNNTPALVILKYYMSLAPYAFSQTIAWAMWLGMLFLLVRFGLNNETMAMKAAGLKISTIIRPLMFMGFLLGIFIFLVNDRVVPHTYKTALELQENHINQKDTPQDQGEVHTNLTYFSGGNRLYYFRKFLPAENTVKDVILLWLDHSESNSRQKMIAEKGLWDGEQWTFYNVMEYQMDSQGRILGEPRTYPVRTYDSITMTPKELLQISLESTFLTYPQKQRSKAKTASVWILKQSKCILAAPWQGLVMMLITVPLLAPTRNRKSIAAKVLFCVILVFVFHVSGAVGLALGKAGKVLPFLGAWGANILFSIAAIFGLDKANH